jgi:Tol biopolymer transport system component
MAADPQISPDGKRIVYVRNSADISSDRRVSNLWIINWRREAWGANKVGLSTSK